MNINKKFDRMKQWGKERMGGEKLSDTTEEFKALEQEMTLRHNGMSKLKKSADVYVQHTAKRDRYQEKDQQLPVAYFGSTMVAHGDDFEPDSEFGQCLSMLGRANERIARMQETYCANATSSWLESLERSLVQMKEYEKARKQLENRRLAYDTASQKMQKSKKEDFRMEEELRNQKMKYEESSEDVYRRMLDIKEAEVDSVQDLSSFLEAELTYYDRCREVLVQLKRDWPVSSRSNTASPVNGRGNNSRGTRSRASSINDRFNTIDEDEPLPPPRRPTISSRVPSGANSPMKEMPGFDLPTRPGIRSASSTGFEGPMSSSYNARSESPANMARLTRVPTEPSTLLGARSNLRITKSRDSSQAPPSSSHEGVFGDDQSSDNNGYSRYDEPPQRTASYGQDGSGAARKAPPPPPPSRASKPKPPPPPMKRSALSMGEVPQHR